jgi:drug/metabolite transporter (DMT)-like permease
MENIGFIYAIGAAMAWGLAYTIDQKILADVSPLTLIFINSLFTTIIIAPFIMYKGEMWKSLISLSRGTQLLIMLEVTLVTAAAFLILSGIKELGASTASILEIIYPFFVVFFSYIFFSQQPNLYFYLGGTLVFAGSLILAKLA